MTWTDPTCRQTNTWIEYIEDNGERVFYLHKETRETTWQKPPNFDEEAWTMGVATPATPDDPDPDVVDGGGPDDADNDDSSRGAISPGQYGSIL